ncbi:helix-turn-helix domain-containing protein [Lentzea californiensis]|uniref:helix-turn-helix domain-containing protein n=1 Tax=Lentzea californiensis TaxID=438851 RepID=UPI0021656E8F|nr:helix-turn-helix domain-containing protein [Lentzea californiensis]MCR3751340.1 transcriptional regulator, IclR family [Lentzea californiensis]
MGRSVLEGAFSLLEELMDEGELGLTQLAVRCEMPKTTVHRLLEQMELLGAVENVCGRYRIGAQMFRFGQAWEPAPGVLRVARQPLRALSATIRTSAILTVPRLDRVLVAAASIVRAEDMTRLRPGATVPAGMEFVSAPVRTPSSNIIGTVSAVLDNGRSATALSGAVGHAARAISAALAS